MTVASQNSTPSSKSTAKTAISVTSPMMTIEFDRLSTLIPPGVGGSPAPQSAETSIIRTLPTAIVIDRNMDTNNTPPRKDRLTHFDEQGNARMIDVGHKPETERVAIAKGRVSMAPETATVIREGRAKKGDVLGVARVAAIMAAKKTADAIPMCHPIPITRVDIGFELDETGVDIEARVDTRGQTGVEMEALHAVSLAALTIYDMVKAIDRGMTVERVRLEYKEGGQSGVWQREAQE